MMLIIHRILSFSIKDFPYYKILSLLIPAHEIFKTLNSKHSMYNIMINNTYMKKYLFIRVDDISCLDEVFLKFFHLFKSLNIPIIYGVIPGKLKKDIISFLNKEKKQAPHLLDITQHGWKHKNYSTSPSLKYEFGDTRNFIQQKKDIYCGLRKMQRVFKNNFTPAFIPPFHGFNESTLRIIDLLEIPIFSNGRSPIKISHTFLNLSTIISLNTYSNKGTPLPKQKKLLIRELFIAINSTDKLIGILLHLNCYKKKTNFDDISSFFQTITTVRKQGKIDIVLFSKLLKKRN